MLVNLAMTADGKIDTVARKGASISSAADKERVLRLRAEVDAVLVGGHTLLAEDPRLTVKLPALEAERMARGLSPNPARVGVVSHIPPGTTLPNFLSGSPAEVFLFTTRHTPRATIAALETAGAQVFVHDGERVDLPAMLETLYDKGIRTMLVEGGGTLIAALLDLGLVDQFWIYMAPKLFGGESAPTPVAGHGWPVSDSIRLQLDSLEQIDEDGGILIQYSIHHITL
jgi:2,5-diamino-6-(ribosylamino)-4(3H)-pyrimidinone 5'-phosphate reductase